MIDSVI